MTSIGEIEWRAGVHNYVYKLRLTTPRWIVRVFTQIRRLKCGKIQINVGVCIRSLNKKQRKPQ